MRIRGPQRSPSTVHLLRLALSDSVSSLRVRRTVVCISTSMPAGSRSPQALLFQSFRPSGRQLHSSSGRQRSFPSGSPREVNPTARRSVVGRLGPTQTVLTKSKRFCSVVGVSATLRRPWQKRNPKRSLKKKARARSSVSISRRSSWLGSSSASPIPSFSRRSSSPAPRWRTHFSSATTSSSIGTSTAPRARACWRACCRGCRACCRVGRFVHGQ